jgi:hypothetical protein
MYGHAGNTGENRGKQGNREEYREIQIYREIKWGMSI